MPSCLRPSTYRPSLCSRRLMLVQTSHQERRDSSLTNLARSLQSIRLSHLHSAWTIPITSLRLQPPKKSQSIDRYGSLSSVKKCPQVPNTTLIRLLVPRKHCLRRVPCNSRTAMTSTIERATSRKISRSTMHVLTQLQQVLHLMMSKKACRTLKSGCLPFHSPRLNNSTYGAKVSWRRFF